MNDVVESLDKYSLTNKDKPNTDSKWVHELLEGLLTSETKCLTCETVSRRDEQFWTFLSILSVTRQSLLV